MGWREVLRLVGETRVDASVSCRLVDVDEGKMRRAFSLWEQESAIWTGPRGRDVSVVTIRLLLARDCGA